MDSEGSFDDSADEGSFDEESTVVSEEAIEDETDDDDDEGDDDETTPPPATPTMDKHEHVAVDVGEEVTLEASTFTLAAMAEEGAKDEAWETQVEFARTHSRTVREAEVEAFAAARSVTSAEGRGGGDGGAAKAAVALDGSADSLPRELTVSKLTLREDGAGGVGAAANGDGDDYYQLAIAGGVGAAAAAAAHNGAKPVPKKDGDKPTIKKSGNDNARKNKKPKQRSFLQSLKKSVVGVGKKVKTKEDQQEKENVVILDGPDAEVRMISGCQDAQYSSDVQNISSFELPDPAGRSGGACTSALLKVLYAEHDAKSKKTKEGKEAEKEDLLPSFVDVLTRMREEIASRGYDQIPQLTASRPVDVNEPFRIVQPNGGGTSRALLIGINYAGQRGELSGCHNDVLNMKHYLVDVSGLDDENITILMDDDDDHPLPTRANILEAWRELAEESVAGDSVFFHFSGHGGKVRDDDLSEEDDSYDETICPLNFRSAGQIRDDDIYETFVRPMSAGVTVTCLMDSCHSGTVLDLPYKFRADEDGDGPGGSSSRSKAMSLDGDFRSGRLFRRADASVENDGGVASTPTKRTRGKVTPTASSPDTTIATKEPISDSEADDDSRCGASV